MLLNGFKYDKSLNKSLNSSIRPTDGTLIGITAPGPGEPESNGNEEILQIYQTPKMEPPHQL